MKSIIILIAILVLKGNVLMAMNSVVSPAVYQTAAGDTSKKYPINDPRNPDCPCHKYQKIADEEYKKLKESEENQEAHEGGINTTGNSEIQNKNSSQSNNSETHGSSKFKRKKTFFYKLKKVSRHQGRQRKKHSVGDCSHW
jgi:hypothetical protein